MPRGFMEAQVHDDDYDGDDHDDHDDLLLRGNRVSSFHSSLWRANGKVRMHSSIGRITEKTGSKKRNNSGKY